MAPAPPSSPPPSSMATRLAALFLRILTFASLFVSMIILVTNSASIDLGVFDLTAKIRFQDVYAYRYLLATTVIGIAYTIKNISSSNCLFKLKDSHGR